MATFTDKYPLTNENYFGKEADKYYMSVSQFKDFAGTLGHTACESAAMAKFLNEIPPVKTTALLVGAYIDAYFEGSLDVFKEENPEIFKKTGDKGLKSDYIQAEQIISRIESDDLFMRFLNGEKQRIMTAELFGIDWKIKMDAYHPDDKIVDLKIMRDMKPVWSDLRHEKMDFIRYWGYDIQGAVYQKVVEIRTGKKLPFFIACATKEASTDIEIIEITQPYLDAALAFVEEHIKHVVDVKSGAVQPERCGKCAYCSSTKKLSSPVTIDSIIPIGSAHDDDDEATDNDTSSAHVTGYSLFGDN